MVGPNVSAEVHATQSQSPALRPRAHSQPSHFERYEPKSCTAPKKLIYENIAEVPQERVSSPLICQGEFGACYAMSARNLLEIGENSAGNKPPILISTIGLLGDVKRGRLQDSAGGEIYVAAQRVRRQNYEIFLDELDPGDGTRDYDRVISGGIEDGLQAIRDRDMVKLESWILTHGSPSLRHYLANPENQATYRKYIEGCSADAPTCLFKSLHPPAVSKRVRIHPFNIYVWERDLKESKARQAKIEEQLHRGYPVGLAVGVHAVTVIGSRRVCCGSPDEKSSSPRDTSHSACHFELKVIDSLEDGKRQIDWFSEDSVVNSTQSMTVLVPCRENGTKGEKQLEECLPYIQGKESIIYSLKAGDVERIETLVRSGQLDPNSMLGFQCVLERAIESGDPKMVEMLLTAGARTFRPPDWYALHGAVREGNPEIIDLFLKRGDSIELKNASGYTPIQVAVSDSVYSAFDFLSKKGADLKVRESDGGNLLETAVYQTGANPLIVKVLLAHGLDPNEMKGSSTENAFHKAVHYAAWSKRTDILETLCRYKADPSIPSKDGKTAFDIAREEHYQAAMDLLKRCASLGKDSRN